MGRWKDVARDDAGGQQADLADHQQAGNEAHRKSNLPVEPVERAVHRRRGRVGGRFGDPHVRRATCRLLPRVLVEN